MKKKYMWLILAVLIVLISMAVSAGTKGEGNAISDIAGIIAKPFQKLYVGIENTFSYGFSYFEDMEKLKEENALLKSKVILLEDKIIESDIINSENERLRTLVELKEKSKDYEMTGASVIAKNPEGYSMSFIIDKGRGDGIVKNSVVLDAGGVIGRIDKVGENWARVIPITEPGTACGVEVSRTGDIGIIEGDYLLGGMCKMTSIAKEANITPGDYIVTSGSGDVYPSGLIIGIIREVREEEISKTAIVEPIGNTKNPKEVMVIINNYTENY